MFLAQAAARRQIDGGRGGRQVHLLSVRSHLGLRRRGYSAYCSTKGGLVMLIKQHASELGKHGVEDRIGNLVGNLIGMAFRDRFRREQSPVVRH